MGGEFGGEGIHVLVWPIPFAWNYHNIVINYIPIQNKKSEKKSMSYGVRLDIRVYFSICCYDLCDFKQVTYVSEPQARKLKWGKYQWGVK